MTTAPAVAASVPARRRGRLSVVVAGSLAVVLFASCSSDSEASDATAPVADVATTGGETAPSSTAAAVVAVSTTTARAGTTTPGTTTPGTTVPGSTVPSSTTPGTTVPVVLPGPTIAPRGIDEEVDYGTGVTASIVDVEAVQVEGHSPGERSGPGVVVTVSVSNGSDETISLDFVTVDLVGADGASATAVDLDEPSALSGDLAPREAATGRYQFFIPAELRTSATITVSYAAGVPTALFTGGLPDA